MCVIFPCVWIEKMLQISTLREIFDRKFYLVDWFGRLKLKILSIVQYFENIQKQNSNCYPKSFFKNIDFVCFVHPTQKLLTVNTLHFYQLLKLSFFIHIKCFKIYNRFLKCSIFLIFQFLYNMSLKKKFPWYRYTI